LIPVAVGILFGFLFIRRQKQLADPLVDLALFRIPAFNASLMVNLAGVFFIFGIFLFQNQYLQLVLGLSPLQAGLWSIGPSLVFTAMSLQAWRVTERFGPVKSVIGGLLVYALGAAVMGVAAYVQNLFGILGASMLMGLGFVPVILTTTGLIVGSAPPERAGSASAISETSAEFGGALGVAVMGSLATFIYRAMMVQADFTALPPDSAQAARGSLGAAVEEARKLSVTDAPWLTLAREAFSDGFALCCILAALALLLLAFVSAKVYAASDIRLGGH
jgi:MFS transporter, DHA2 family, multidrug resistance protein